MKNEVNVKNSSNHSHYLSEFEMYDGERFVTFNILDIDTDKREISVAITNEGKISVNTFDLLSDGGCLYFEYGVMLERISIDDFTQEVR